MNNSLFIELVESFNEESLKDFELVESILDKNIFGPDVVLISNDPYFLTHIFTALIKKDGINIHILNPSEGTHELQRLIYSINPKSVIVTDKELSEELQYKRLFLINANEITKHAKSHVAKVPDEIDFNIITYSPSPTRINRIKGSVFETMVESIRTDMDNLGLIKWSDKGIIPIATNNPDYLLYFVALQISKFGSYSSYTRLELPDSDLVAWPIDHTKDYLALNKATTLFIPKKEFLLLWEKEVSSIFENRFIFKSYLKRKWLVNMFIRWKLKKLFYGFKNVLIIGSLNNAYMIDVLKNLSFVKFYSVFTINNLMSFGPISESLDSIKISSNSYRQDIVNYYHKNVALTNNLVYTLSFRLSSEDNVIHNLVNTGERFICNEKDRKELFPLGNINNSFQKNGVHIFPETLEKVINSYPFLRNCVLLTFNKRMILVVHPNLNTLDSNRINYKMFSSILQKQIDALNKELPEEYQIQGFVITTSLIELDRDGEIVRYPFNHCNSMDEVVTEYL